MAVNAYSLSRAVQDRAPARRMPSTSFLLALARARSSVIGAGSSGGEARAGRADVSELSIMKVTDKLTPALFDDCVLGTYLDEVDIIYDKPLGNRTGRLLQDPHGEGPDHFWQTSGSAENPTESISFAFDKIKVSYNPEEGGKLKGFVDKGFDVLKLKQW